MSVMSYSRTVAWSELGDLDGIIHPRDIIERRRERAKTATRFTVSDGFAPMSKGWAAYNKATIAVRDQWGNQHMVTAKTHTVLLIALGRIARNETSTTLREIGTEAKVCAQTVANALRKFTAWGILATGSVRGKYGGLILFARSKGDGLEHFARMAAQYLREAWARKMDRFRARSNVQTLVDGGSKRLGTSYLSSSLDIRIRRDDEIEGVFMSQQRGAMKRVPCPAHGGEDRNLSFWRRPDGSLGVKCWSHQCTEREVKDAVVPWSPQQFREAGII